MPVESGTRLLCGRQATHPREWRRKMMIQQAIYQVMSPAWEHASGHPCGSLMEASKSEPVARRKAARSRRC